MIRAHWDEDKLKNIHSNLFPHNELDSTVRLQIVKMANPDKILNIWFLIISDLIPLKELTHSTDSIQGSDYIVIFISLISLFLEQYLEI